MRESFESYIERWSDEFTGEAVVTLLEFDDIMLLPVAHVADVYGSLEVSGDHIAQWRDHIGPTNVFMTRLAAQDRRRRA